MDENTSDGSGLGCLVLIVLVFMVIDGAYYPLAIMIGLIALAEAYYRRRK